MMKIRMVQLRCRYNNEKRKLDQIRLTDPSATLNWRLFHPLRFLDDHIKPRKSYNLSKHSETSYIEPPTFNPQPKRRGRPPKKINYVETPDPEPMSPPTPPAQHQMSSLSDSDREPPPEIKQEEDSNGPVDTPQNDDSFVDSVSYL